MRPMLPAEPACWSWPVPPVRERDDVFAQLMADASSEPDFNHAEVVIRSKMRTYNKWVQRFSEFHNNRCAICGGSYDRYHLVLDHDHESDLLRGYLCARCNVAEGRAPADHPLFAAYRLRHPAEIVGYVELYASAKRRGVRSSAFHQFKGWAVTTAAEMKKTTDDARYIADLARVALNVLVRHRGEDTRFDKKVESAIRKARSVEGVDVSVFVPLVVVLGRHGEDDCGDEHRLRLLRKVRQKMVERAPELHYLAGMVGLT